MIQFSIILNFEEKFKLFFFCRKLRHIASLLRVYLSANRLKLTVCGGAPKFHNNLWTYKSTQALMGTCLFIMYCVHL